MLHKNRNTTQPYITCLSIIHKLFTSLINNKIYKHCNTNHILEEEQKGCIWKCLGCKQQLTINATVLKQAHVKKRNVHVLCRLSKKVSLCAPWLVDEGVRNTQNLPRD